MNNSAREMVSAGVQIKDNLNVFVHEVTDFYSHLMINVMCDLKYKKK